MSRSKKRAFKEQYKSLTIIGLEFNLSARFVGQELTRLGFRNKAGTPVKKTLNERIAVPTPLRSGKAFYMWDFKKTCKILSEHHPKDKQSKARSIIKSMNFVLDSDEWEHGGGILYKFAVEEFFDLIDDFLKLGDVKNNMALIEETKIKKENKAQILECLNEHIKTKSENPLI